MKRVLCLYKVSTLKQVDRKDDIPMQRRECREFIDRMDDWVFYDERMEKGISLISLILWLRPLPSGLAAAYNQYVRRLEQAPGKTWQKPG